MCCSLHTVLGAASAGCRAHWYRLLAFLGPPPQLKASLHAMQVAEGLGEDAVLGVITEELAPREVSPSHTANVLLTYLQAVVMSHLAGSQC